MKQNFHFTWRAFIAWDGTGDILGDCEGSCKQESTHTVRMLQYQYVICRTMDEQLI